MNRKIDYLLGVPLVWLLSLRKRGQPAAAPPPRKILVIKLAAVGDTILLVPVLRSLKKTFPGAAIHWLVSPINEAIARTVPYADRITVWKNRSLFGLTDLVRQLRGERYDAVVDFEQWARGTAILSFLSNAPLRLGFDTPNQHRARLYTHTLVKNFENHEIFDFFNLLGTAFTVSRDSELQLWETGAGKIELSEKMPPQERRPNGPRVLLHPGCGSDGLPREWPLSSYAVLGHWLIKQRRARIYLSGGPEERHKTATLKKLLNGEARDLGGQLSWPAIVSLVGDMDLVISGNTGVMHVAAALKKPQIALHGPTNPVLWGPLNPKARVIQSSCPTCPSLKLGFEYHSRNQVCMKKIEIDEVKSAVSSLFEIW